MRAGIGTSPRIHFDITPGFSDQILFTEDDIRRWAESQPYSEKDEIIQKLSQIILRLLEDQSDILVVESGGNVGIGT